MRLSCTTMKIWSLKDCEVMTLSFWGHVTSSVMWPFDYPCEVSYRWSMVTMHLPCTASEIYSLKDIGVTTLTFCGHVTSSVTWPLKSACVVSYWWSIVTMRLSCTVMEIWSLKDFLVTTLTFQQCYALPCYTVMLFMGAWKTHLNMAHWGRINAFLKRAFKCGFSGELITVEQLLYSLATGLFSKTHNPLHCLHRLLRLLRKLTIHCETANSLYYLSVNMNCLKCRMLTGAFLMTCDLFSLSLLSHYFYYWVCNFNLQCFVCTFVANINKIIVITTYS